MSWNRWTGLIFLDDRWAYRGIPESGGLPKCTSRTVGVDEDGDPTPGCVPYTYDARTHALTVDGQPATMNRNLDGLTIGEDAYGYSPLVRAGTRFAADLKVVNISGFWPNQNVNQKFFTFFADGNFTVSSETFGTFGGLPGTPGSGNYAVVPPDSKGTYAFGEQGELRMDYADGRSTVKIAGILPNEGDGSTDPAIAGFLWGEEQFYKPDE